MDVREHKEMKVAKQAAAIKLAHKQKRYGG